MTFFFELCLSLPEISFALGGSDTSFHLGLIGFSIVFSPISMLSGILMNYISRKNEFEADAYAKQTFNGEDLALALKKLSVIAFLISTLIPCTFSFITLILHL